MIDGSVKYFTPNLLKEDYRGIVGDIFDQLGQYSPLAVYSAIVATFSLIIGTLALVRSKRAMSKIKKMIKREVVDPLRPLDKSWESLNQMEKLCLTRWASSKLSNEALSIEQIKSFKTLYPEVTIVSLIEEKWVYKTEDGLHVINSDRLRYIQESARLLDQDGMTKM